MQLMNTHINNTKTFDVLCDRTFAKLIYGTEQVEDWNVSAERWIDARREDFDKIYLDERRKM